MLKWHWKARCNLVLKENWFISWFWNLYLRFLNILLRSSWPIEGRMRKIGSLKPFKISFIIINFSIFSTITNPLSPFGFSLFPFNSDFIYFSVLLFFWGYFSCWSAFELLLDFLWWSNLGYVHLVTNSSLWSRWWQHLLVSQVCLLALSHICPFSLSQICLGSFILIY